MVVAFSPDGKRVVSGSGDSGCGGSEAVAGFLSTWNAATGEQVSRFVGVR